MEIPKVLLSSGAEIPMLAYGTGTLWMKEDGAEIDRPTVDGIKTAIKLGYRHLDGAQYYRTEPELGLAVEESGIPRSEFFITTKANSPINVEASLRTSLEMMKTDYVDLYLLHEPFSSKTEEALQNTWKAMEQCLEKGLARSIGVSNFLVSHLETIMKIAKVKPAVNQIEMNPYLQRQEVVQYSKQHDIAIEAFGPLTPLTKASPGPIDEVSIRLADKYGVSDSAILLRWLLDQGIVVITTSSRQERLAQYLKDVPSFQLTKEEIEEISSLGKGKNFRGFFVEAYGADCFL